MRSYTTLRDVTRESRDQRLRDLGFTVEQRSGTNVLVGGQAVHLA
jgi:hypothetical protein